MSNTQVILVSAIHKELFFSQAPRRRALGDLGIRYIAAYLNENGVLTDIMPSYEYTTSALLDYLRSHSEVKVVGFSMHTISADNSLNDVRVIKKNFPNIKVWLGGFLPTFGWRFLLDTDCPFDYIMRGDGEIASLELCKKIIACEKHIAIDGVITRGDRDTYKALFCPVADIETLPFPFFNEKDKEQNVAEYMISASRGCYGRCTFCSIPAFNSCRRERSVHSVVTEMKRLKSEFKAAFIDFVDDSFLGATCWEERASEFAAVTEQLDARLPYRISLRANNITDSVLANLKRSGLVAVQLGVESFSRRQLKLYNKGVTAARALEAIRTLEKNKVYVQCGLILFEPTTTLEDLIINARILTEEKWAVVKSNSQMLYCAEGTAIGKRLKEFRADLGIDGYLNYRWEYDDERVNIVRRVVVAYEKSLGGYSDILVDAITPPSFISEENYTKIRLLQNEYQRLSFAALDAACETVTRIDNPSAILAELDSKFGNRFAKIITEANKILEGCRNG